MSTNKFAGVFDEKTNNNNILEQNPSQEQVHITPKIDCLFDPDAKDERGIFLRHLDPRPDLEQDHELWTIILNNALLLHGLPENLYGTLHFLRASGAGLEQVDNELGFKLVQGQWDAAATGLSWDGAKKKCLEPVRDGLVALFKFSYKHGMLPAPADVFDQEKAETKHQLVFGETDPRQFKKSR